MLLLKDFDVDIRVLFDEDCPRNFTGVAYVEEYNKVSYFVSGVIHREFEPACYYFDYSGVMSFACYALHGLEFMYEEGAYWRDLYKLYKDDPRAAEIMGKIMELQDE